MTLAPADPLFGNICGLFQCGDLFDVQLSPGRKAGTYGKIQLPAVRKKKKCSVQSKETQQEAVQADHTNHTTYYNIWFVPTDTPYFQDALILSSIITVTRTSQKLQSLSPSAEPPLFPKPKQKQNP